MWAEIKDACSVPGEEPLEEGTLTHCNILAWRIPRTEEPGRLQSIGWQRVRHKWNDLVHTHVTTQCSSAIRIQMAWLMKTIPWVSPLERIMRQNHEAHVFPHHYKIHLQNGLFACILRCAWPFAAYGQSTLLCPWDSPGKNTGVGCHFLLQGIFPTQDLNPSFLHCRWILYPLSQLRNLQNELNRSDTSPHFLLPLC